MTTFKWLIPVLLAAVTAVCGGGEASDSAQVIVENQPVVTLTLNPPLVARGESSVLSWSVDGATSCQASGAWTGDRTIAGSSIAVQPDTTSTYTLTCDGPGGGQGEDSEQLTVVEPPVITFSADPTLIAVGLDATLTWSVTDADTCTASGAWTGGRPLSDNEVVSPAPPGSYTYTLTCDGPGGGRDVESVTVTVVAQPTVQLTANPTLVAAGVSSELSWLVTGANQCTASGGWTGSRSPGPSTESVEPQISTDYTLTCQGDGGGEATDTVRVDVEAQPTVSLTVTPTTIANGLEAELVWTTTNADACTATGGWTGARPASGGQETVSPGATTSYTISCTGPGAGSAEDVATLTVVDQPTLTFSATPDLVAVGESALLEWSTTGAEGCTASDGWVGDRGISGSLERTPSADTRYTLTCTGPGGGSIPGFVDVEVAPQPTVELRADPDLAALNSNTTELSWTSTGATSCTASSNPPGGWEGLRAPENEEIVQPEETTTFILTCEGPGNGRSAPDSVVVTVVPPPEVAFAVEPATVAVGVPATLTWTATGADRCEASTGWSGQRPTEGEEQVQPSDDQTYTLTCFGPGGGQTVEFAELSVVPQPTVTLDPDPLVIAEGDASKLRWRTENADECTASGGWTGDKGTGGNEDVTPSETTTYVISCTGDGGGEASDSAQVIVAPLGTLIMTADPPIIPIGGTSNIGWFASDATGCEALGGDSEWRDQQPPPGPSGTRAVSPTDDRSWSLRCTGPGGAITESVTIEVRPPPEVGLEVFPGQLAEGETATLTYDIRLAEECTASGGWTGDVQPVPGSADVTVQVDTTYGLTCVGFGGQTVDSVTVEVIPAPEIELTADPVVIPMQGASTLSWTVTDAESCEASGGWSGERNAESGGEVVAPEGTTTYTLTCDGIGGTREASVEVQVAPMPTVSLTADPPEIQEGQNTSLVWESTGATACQASGGWTGVRDVGPLSELQGPAIDTTYTLTCTGPGGQASATTAVTVYPNPTVDITASLELVAVGGSTVLSWAATDAVSCVASRAWAGDKGVGPTSQIVTPLSVAGNDYTIACMGDGGVATDTVTVGINIQDDNPRPTIAINADPVLVGAGEPTTLLWDTRLALSCEASGSWSGPRPIGINSFDVFPAGPTDRYLLTCQGPGGSSFDFVDVGVAPSPQVTLTADPIAVPIGGQATLRWTPTDANLCVASGDWSGEKDPSGGTEVVTIDEDSTFLILCTGLSGETDTVSATVRADPAPELQFSASPRIIALGERAELTWSATPDDDETVCEATGDWDDPELPRSSAAVAPFYVEPQEDASYTVECTRPGGTVSATVPVTVDPNRGIVDLESWAEDVELAPNLECAGAGPSVVVATRDKGLVCVDLSNPAVLTSATLFDPGICSDGSLRPPVEQDFELEGVELLGNRAYLSAAQCGVFTLPLEPVGAPVLQETSGWATDVHLEPGSELGLVADYNGGVVVLDLSDPARPSELAVYGHPDPAFGPAIDIDGFGALGRFAYVAGADGLRILDLAERAAPVEIGRVDMDDTPGAVPQDVEARGTVVYVSAWTDGLWVVDASSFGSPQVVARIPTDAAVHEAVLSGNRLYLAEGSAGVRIFDISQPLAPVELHRIYTGVYVWDIEVSDGRIILGYGVLNDDGPHGGGVKVLRDR